MAGSSHGHTPAAWTGVTVCFVGFLISGAFTVMAEPIGFWAGLLVVLLGGVVGMVMRAKGLGQQQPQKVQPKPQAAQAQAKAQPQEATAGH